MKYLFLIILATVLCGCSNSPDYKLIFQHEGEHPIHDYIISGNIIFIDSAFIESDTMTDVAVVFKDYRKAAISGEGKTIALEFEDSLHYIPETEYYYVKHTIDTGIEPDTVLIGDTVTIIGQSEANVKVMTIQYQPNSWWRKTLCIDFDGLPDDGTCFGYIVEE